MTDSTSDSLGIIESDYPYYEPPYSDIWTFIYPYLLRWKDRPAVVCSNTNKSYTYAEITEASLRWGKELLKHFHGQNPPNVAIICPNVIEFPILYLGSFAVGCPVTAIRHTYNPDLVMHFLRETCASIVVVDSSVIKDLQDTIQNVGHKIKIYVRNSEENSIEGAMDLMQVLFSQKEGLSPEEARKLNVGPESTALIGFSSGTTGKPKGILLSHKALIFDKKGSQELSKDHPQETVIGNIGYFTVFSVHAYFIAGMIKGLRIVNISSDCTFTQLLNVVERFKPEMCFLRGYSVERLLSLDTEELKNQLKSVLTLGNVGTPKNSAAIEKLRTKLGRKILIREVYGASEVGMVISTPRGIDGDGMTGKLLSNVKGRFIDLNTGKPVEKPYTHGELLLLTPGIMDGYLNNPDATATAIDSEGWYRTGDVGFYDENKEIKIVDRVRDIVENKGTKLYPSDVENILLSHEAVLDAGVVGVVDTKTKEEVAKAFVVNKEHVEEKDLLSYVHKNGGVWLHGGVSFVESLPRNHMGKLMRKFVKEMAWNVSHKLSL